MAKQQTRTCAKSLTHADLRIGMPVLYQTEHGMIEPRRGVVSELSPSDAHVEFFRVTGWDRALHMTSTYVAHDPDAVPSVKETRKPKRTPATAPPPQPPIAETAPAEPTPPIAEPTPGESEYIMTTARKASIAKARARSRQVMTLTDAGHKLRKDFCYAVRGRHAETGRDINDIITEVLSDPIYANLKPKTSNKPITQQTYNYWRLRYKIPARPPVETTPPAPEEKPPPTQTPPPVESDLPAWNICADCGRHYSSAIDMCPDCNPDTFKATPTPAAPQSEAYADFSDNGIKCLKRSFLVDTTRHAIEQVAVDMTFTDDGERLSISPAAWSLLITRLKRIEHGIRNMKTNASGGRGDNVPPNPPESPLTPAGAAASAGAAQ